MQYHGRIFVVAINLLMIVLVKFYGFFQYNISLDTLPFFSIIILPISYFLGRQYDMVKYLSEKDSLTKVYNRRYVINTFPKLSALADRKSWKLNIYLIDVNQFKAINDTYGHEKGDKVLQKLSSLLLANTRKCDMVARWAGDEFLVIVPSNDEEMNNMIFDLVNKELEKSFEEQDIDISVSFGSSQYPKCSRKLEELIHIADVNMYNMKFQKYL